MCPQVNEDMFPAFLRAENVYRDTPSQVMLKMQAMKHREQEEVRWRRTKVTAPTPATQCVMHQIKNALNKFLRSPVSDLTRLCQLDPCTRTRTVEPDTLLRDMHTLALKVTDFRKGGNTGFARGVRDALFDFSEFDNWQSWRGAVIEQDR